MVQIASALKLLQQTASAPRIVSIAHATEAKTTASSDDERASMMLLGVHSASVRDDARASPN
jgi:hypothetical protein